MRGNLDQGLFLRGLADELFCFVEQAELIAMDPLAAGSEALALEQSDLLAELLDLEVALLDSGTAFHDERLQSFDIIWK